MCGIAGFVGRRSSSISENVLQDMADVIAHRGPDDEGYLRMTTADGKSVVELAHRRLSIIDLATGHQPMQNESGRVHVVFNGEIYNFHALRDQLLARGHVFRTVSDTETIVHAYEEWGADCVQRFRGMFAFAIWDADEERLLLARDRFGKKPLFMCEHQGLLLFGSEIKSILAFPGIRPEVDRESVGTYFSYRYVPAPRTLFKNIRKVLPGTFILWQKGKVTESKYYNPPDGEVRPAGQTIKGDVAEQFLKRLDEAVRIRMISDVPFGAFLSGGIDSSAVVALMSRHLNQPVKTFSVGFAEAAYDELAHSRAIAKRFSTEHHELRVSQDEIMSLLPSLVRFRDAPVAEPSDVPIYLLAREARKSVKMVLTGEGADEFLGGYPKHVFERFARPYQYLPRLLRHDLLEPAVRLLPFKYHRAKTAIANLGIECFEERMPRWFGAISEEEKAQLLTFSERAADDASRRPKSTADSSALRQILYFDQRSWLPDNLLERGDSMTMAASLEGRMPFVDHELAAFVSSLPDHYRVRGFTTKWILRESMKAILPPTTLGRSKVGFRVPVAEWFRGPMRDYLYEHLCSSASRTAPYYHRKALDRVMAEHVEGRQNHEKLLWTLLNLEIWHRQYLDSGPA